MIKSMTGFGSAKGVVEGIEITVELKSVNNRYLDTSVRLPRNFLFAEEAIKAAVQSHIRVSITPFPLLKGYVEALNRISEEYSVPADLNALALSRFPDVLSVEKKELDSEKLTEGIREIAETALCDFDAMRTREGEKLRADVLSKLDTIAALVSGVEEKAPQTVADYRRRLTQKMTEVLETAGIDESRILTEAAVFADKVAVDEETVRLRSHMSQLAIMINGDSPTGRKIDFLIQEFNREANTIGSKCQNSEIAYLVVDIKSEIEKIREQIQNIE